jgi:predicted Zn-ribbon and HTH transcriptional regulator
MYHPVTQEAPSPRGGKAPPDPSPSSAPDAADDFSAKNARKERVLHTRVPAVLERELKRFADNLRVPVSNLVRAILEDALTVADAAGTNVEERLKSAARTIEQERERLKKRVHVDPIAGIFAFQDVTLAQPSRCAKCDRELSRGARAHLGMSEGPKRGPNVIVCDACLPRV